MSFEILWDHAALAAFAEVPWPRSADVDAAILRFAEQRAQLLESGRYRIRVGRFDVAVRVDHAACRVLVLHVYQP